MISYQNKTDYNNAELYRNLYENCKNYILERNINYTDNKYQE